MGWLELLRAPKSPVLGMNRRNLEFVLPRNPRAAFPLANDKRLAKEVMSAAGVPVPGNLASFSSFHEVSLLQERLRGHDDFVVKPARGYGGRGIMVIVDREDDGFVDVKGRAVPWRSLRRHVADIIFGVYTLDQPDDALIEPRLQPSPFFSKLYPGALSDLRIIAVDGQLIASMIRVPTSASGGRANLHQGGLGIGVNIENGAVLGGWSNRQRVTHLEDGTPLAGMVVPLWPEIRDIALRAAACVPLRFLGIDLVVEKDLGPLVLEINARPGLEIQNVTGTPLRPLLKQMLGNGKVR